MQLPPMMSALLDGLRDAACTLAGDAPPPLHTRSPHVGCHIHRLLNRRTCLLPEFAARVATVSRKTKETSVKVTINLDGTGKCHSKTQVGAETQLENSVC